MSNEQNRAAIDEIISRIDIVDLISENVVLKKSGSGYQGLCPFHQEKSPSFHVSQQKQIFRCFGCNVGGNIIEYYKNYHHLNFIDTLKELAQRCGVELQYNKEKSPENQKKEELKKTIYQAYKEATEFYQWNLIHNDSSGQIARNYLKQRKVPKGMIDKFLIGYSPNSWDGLYLFLQKKGFSPDEIKESGLVVEKEHGGYYDRFRNRLMFPIQNEKDEVIAFGGRILDNDSNQAKYINSSESSIYIKGQHLYALNFAKNKIREKSEVILVEGYLDVISCHEFGFENTVASLGTALTPDQAKKLLRYNTSKKVIVAYDSDKAGKKAAEKGTLVLEEVSKGTGINLYILQVPSGKDPDDFLHGEHSDQFQQVIDSAKPIIEFQIEEALSSDFSNSENKTKIVERCVEVLLKIKDAIYRSEMITKIVNWQVNGQKINIREEDLRRTLKISDFTTNRSEQKDTASNSIPYQQYNNKFQKKEYKPKYDKNVVDFDYHKKRISQAILAKYEKEPGALQAEKGIIYYMVERVKALDYIKKRLENTEFQDPLNEKIKNIIFNLNETNNIKGWKELLREMPESDEQVRVVEIWEGFSNINVASDKILKDYLKQVKLNFLKLQRDEIRVGVDEAGSIDEKEIVEQLIVEYQLVQASIKKLESEIYSN
ncbi:MAG: DNA primase [Candidatus Sericytochromatia bacterium]|nr:DNA primase [Candidatus Sericytochromatia bacterium]